MSQIATFIIIPATSFEELATAAAPQLTAIPRRRWIFFSHEVQELRDEYAETLLRLGHQPEPSNLSGNLFVDMDLALRTRGVNLFKLGTKSLTARISEARSSLLEEPKRAWPVKLKASVPVFDSSAASNALAALNSLDDAAEAFRLIASENHAPEDREAAVSTMAEWYEVVKRWLSAVGESELGVLSVG